MNEETIERIISWQTESQKQTNKYVRFFMLYMCFDAWLSALSEEEYDNQKNEWLCTEANVIKDGWASLQEELRRPLGRLTTIGVVENMHPMHRGEQIHINDGENFKDVISFMYQIRCNLFHGGKSAVNTHDKELVDASTNVLEVFIRVIIEKWREQTRV